MMSDSELQLTDELGGHLQKNPFQRRRWEPVLQPRHLTVILEVVARVLMVLQQVCSIGCMEEAFVVPFLHWGSSCGSPWANAAAAGHRYKERNDAVGGGEALPFHFSYTRGSAARGVNAFSGMGRPPEPPSATNASTRVRSRRRGDVDGKESRRKKGRTSVAAFPSPSGPLVPRRAWPRMGAAERSGDTAIGRAPDAEEDWARGDRRIGGWPANFDAHESVIDGRKLDCRAGLSIV